MSFVRKDLINLSKKIGVICNRTSLFYKVNEKYEDMKKVEYDDLVIAITSLEKILIQLELCIYESTDVDNIENPKIDIISNIHIDRIIHITAMLFDLTSTPLFKEFICDIQILSPETTRKLNLLQNIRSLSLNEYNKRASENFFRRHLNEFKRTIDRYALIDDKVRQLNYINLSKLK